MIRTMLAAVVFAGLMALGLAGSFVVAAQASDQCYTLPNPIKPGQVFAVCFRKAGKRVKLVCVGDPEMSALFNARECR